MEFPTSQWPANTCRGRRGHGLSMRRSPNLKDPDSIRRDQPEREDERKRIEAADGRVIYWDGYRVGGLLALSRSIGDRYLKQYVVSEPEVTCMLRTEEDECLILASDGLWDVVSNDTACEIARKCLLSKKRNSKVQSHGQEDSAAAAVAALLVKLAYGRGSKDNISVVVVDLKHSGTM